MEADQSCILSGWPSASFSSLELRKPVSCYTGFSRGLKGQLLVSKPVTFPSGSPCCVTFSFWVPIFLRWGCVASYSSASAGLSKSFPAEAANGWFERGGTQRLSALMEEKWFSLACGIMDAGWSVYLTWNCEVFPFCHKPKSRHLKFCPWNTKIQTISSDHGSPVGPSQTCSKLMRLIVQTMPLLFCVKLYFLCLCLVHPSLELIYLKQRGSEGYSRIPGGRCSFYFTFSFLLDSPLALSLAVVF